MKTIYLSGKITGDKMYLAKFLKAEQQIKKDTGCRVINPIHVRPTFGIKRWFFYMLPAMRNVFDSDAIYLLPDWKQSKGAIIEFIAAWFMRKDIYYIQERPKGNTKETKKSWVVMSRIPFSKHQFPIKYVPKYVKR